MGDTKVTSSPSKRLSDDFRPKFELKSKRVIRFTQSFACRWNLAYSRLSTQKTGNIYVFCTGGPKVTFPRSKHL